MNDAVKASVTTTGLAVTGIGTYTGNVSSGTTDTSSYRFYAYGGDIGINTQSDARYIVGLKGNGYYLWIHAAGSPTATNFGIRIATVANDLDKQVEFHYTPGTTGAGAGILNVGQVYKTNANFTHGVTAFYTLGSERMRIDKEGKVGIGTTAPTSLLHVAGDVTVGGHINNNNLSQIFQSIRQACDGYVSDLTLVQNKNAQYQVNQSIRQSLDGYVTSSQGYDGYIAFFTTATKNIAGDNDLFWDRENNRLGVGTSTPIAKLEVNGDIAGPKVMLTPEGGFAIKLTNKTGNSSVKGEVVKASTANDMAVELAYFMRVELQMEAKHGLLFLE
jgi:hypothetical protein